MVHADALVTQDQLEEMQDLWREDEVSKPSGFVLIRDEIVDQRRWVTVNHRVVKTPDGRFFSYHYADNNALLLLIIIRKGML